MDHKVFYYIVGALLFISLASFIFVDHNRFSSLFFGSDITPPSNCWSVFDKNILNPGAKRYRCDSSTILLKQYCDKEAIFSSEIITCNMFGSDYGCDFEEPACKSPSETYRLSSNVIKYAQFRPVFHRPF